MRMFACFVVALVAVLLLGAAGPAKAESIGAWQISQKTDPVTGAKIAHVYIQSSKMAHTGELFAMRSYLQLGCLKGQRILQFVFAFQVGSKADSDVAYGFDRVPNQRVTARFMRGLKVMVIENKKDVAKFFDGLAAAKVLNLTIESMAKGRTSAQYPVAGAASVVKLVRTNCR